MAERYFVTGIGTGIGKTIVSAILTEALQADYWKPIQSGDLDNSDTLKVKNLILNSKTIFHPERYRLTQPFSPHKSAKIDGIEIKLSDFKLPETDNNLIIEGAGGLMVPLNDSDLIIDLIKVLDARIILISQNYLGSINHTLLSWEMLLQYGIPVKGMIFNGKPDEETERYLLQYTGMKLLGRIPELGDLNKKSISDATKHLDLF